MRKDKVINVSYFLLSYLVLFFVRAVSDLPISIGNASEKARAILHLTAPSDNFYPIGKALLLIPFLWNGPDYFLAILFYFSIGVIAYFYICRDIKNLGFRTCALLALPFNPYLIWLIYTSQDTVFEFSLLIVLILLTLKKRIWFILLVGLLLSLTRSGYWPVYLFLFCVTLYKLRHKFTKKLLVLSVILIVSMAPINLATNYFIFGNADFAEESGVTAYFSYNKYLYLALPTFDMDVFLSTKGHGWSNDDKTSADYKKLAIQSIKDNPKQITLATLQKIDSYIFDIQKVPHLPGEYFLSEDAKSIQIGNERLTWFLVLGNVGYALYRMIIIVGFFLMIGGLLFAHKLKLKIQTLENSWILAIPWVLGFIPGIIFYTETRFKIVSELLLAPLVALFWQSEKGSKEDGDLRAQK